MNFPTPSLNKFFQDQPNQFQKGIFSIFGDFGVGKTTFALQTAINTARLTQKVLFIYSKPKFPDKMIKNVLSPIHSSEISKIQENLVFIQTTTFNKLSEIVFNLEFLILNNRNQNKKTLSLIVIDSLTELYRLELDKNSKEKNFELNFRLNQLLANLIFLYEQYSVNILIVNEISTIDQDGQFKEVQSGGKVTDYWIPTSIQITRTDKLNERRFAIVKSPIKKKLEFTVNLTENGFK